MNRWKSCVVVVGAMLVASCGSSGGTEPGGGGPGPGGGVGAGCGNNTTSSISVTDNKFTPCATTVPKGTTITWTWNGSADHNVTFPDAASATQSSGTYSKKFDNAGTFDYSCTLHAGMSGSITVQ